MATSIKLDTDLKLRLQLLAQRRDRSPHWLMREAIKSYIEREERREALKEDALKAWLQYQETGRHVTATEADKWLESLVEGNDKEPPECHG